ncbi:MAG: type II secretion system protein GspM [Alphaproteobacteria bacterium]|nr:type II secretion system protein GspM [Alphaproteobacteria bacterium]
MNARLPSLDRRWKSLAPRERILIQAAMGLMITLAAIYGGLIPGLQAEKSAADRHRHAQVEMAAIQSLALSVADHLSRAAAAPADPAPAIREVAASYGLSVQGIEPSDGSVIVEVRAPSSSSILSWIAMTSNRISHGAQEISISRHEDGAVVARVTFADGRR